MKEHETMTNFHSIDVTQVTNVTLNVKDLNKLTDFYSNVLGFLLKNKRINKPYSTSEILVII